MKIIDILNKKANGTLEDGFKFKYDDTIFIFDKLDDEITNENGIRIGYYFELENQLNDEVEVIEESKEIEELRTGIDEDNMRYVEYSSNGHTPSGYSKSYNRFDVEIVDKINKIIQTVNKLIKEREEK